MKQGFKAPWNKFWNEIRLQIIVVIFTEEILNCLADVFHSVYENILRNSNTEGTKFHKKGVVTVTFLL